MSPQLTKDPAAGPYKTNRIQAAVPCIRYQNVCCFCHRVGLSNKPFTQCLHVEPLCFRESELQRELNWYWYCYIYCLAHQCPFGWQYLVSNLLSFISPSWAYGGNRHSFYPPLIWGKMPVLAQDSHCKGQLDLDQLFCRASQRIWGLCWVLKPLLIVLEFYRFESESVISPNLLTSLCKEHLLGNKVGPLGIRVPRYSL